MGKSSFTIQLSSSLAKSASLAQQHSTFHLGMVSHAYVGFQVSYQLEVCLSATLALLVFHPRFSYTQ